MVIIDIQIFYSWNSGCRTRTGPVHLTVRCSLSVSSRLSLPGFHPKLHVLVLRFRLRTHQNDHKECHSRIIRCPRTRRRYLDVSRRYYHEILRRSSRSRCERHTGPWHEHLQRNKFDALNVILVMCISAIML